MVACKITLGRVGRILGLDPPLQHLITAFSESIRSDLLVYRNLAALTSLPRTVTVTGCSFVIPPCLRKSRRINNRRLKSFPDTVTVTLKESPLLSTPTLQWCP